MKQSSSAELRSFDLSFLETKAVEVITFIRQREDEFAARDKLEADAKETSAENSRLTGELESMSLLESEIRDQLYTLEEEKKTFEAKRTQEKERLKADFDVEIEELQRKLKAASEAEKILIAKRVKEAQQAFDKQIKLNDANAIRMAEKVNQLEMEQKKVAAEIAAKQVAAASKKEVKEL